METKVTHALQQLEAELAAINAPFHVHVLQRNALKKCFDSLADPKQEAINGGVPAPQLSVNGKYPVSPGDLASLSRRELRALLKKSTKP